MVWQLWVGFLTSLAYRLGELGRMSRSQANHGNILATARGPGRTNTNGGVRVHQILARFEQIIDRGGGFFIVQNVAAKHLTSFTQSALVECHSAGFDLMLQAPSSSPVQSVASK